MIIIWVIAIIIILVLYIYVDNDWHYAGKISANKLKPNTPNKLKPNTPNKLKPNTPNKLKPNTPNKLKPNTPNQANNILLDAKNKKQCSSQSGVWLNSVSSCVSQSAKLQAKDSKSCSSQNGIWIDKTCLSPSNIPQDEQRRRRFGAFINDGGGSSPNNITLYGSNGKPVKVPGLSKNPLKPGSVYTMKDGTSWQIDSTGTRVSQCSSKPDHSELRYLAGGGGLVPCRGRGTPGDLLVQGAINAVRGRLPGGNSGYENVPPQPTQQPRMTVQEYAARRFISTNRSGTYEDMVKRYGKLVSREEFEKITREMYSASAPSTDPYVPSAPLDPSAPGYDPYAPSAPPAGYNPYAPPPVQIGQMPLTAGTIAGAYRGLSPMISAVTTSPGTIVPTYAQTALSSIESYLRQHPPPLQQGGGIRNWIGDFLSNNRDQLENIARWRTADSTVQRSPVAQMILNHVDANRGGGATQTFWNNVNSVNRLIGSIYQDSESSNFFRPGQPYSIDDLFPAQVWQM
jgi:hypothetical protein